MVEAEGNQGEVGQETCRMTAGIGEGTMEPKPRIDEQGEPVCAGAECPIFIAENERQRHAMSEALAAVRGGLPEVAIVCLDAAIASSRSNNGVVGYCGRCHSPMVVGSTKPCTGCMVESVQPALRGEEG